MLMRKNNAEFSTKTKQSKENSNMRCICDQSQQYIQFYIFPTSLKYVHLTISWSLLLPLIHQVSFSMLEVASYNTDEEQLYI